MSRKSSIHFKPVSNVRFAVSHSERTDLSEPAYLLPKEFQLDNIVLTGSLSENDLSALFIQQKEGMSRQAKTAGSSPFWEGVVVLPNINGHEQCTNLQAWKVAYEQATGHKVLHMSVHLDEGYMGTDGKPQYNPHSHVIVSRMNSKNRVIHLGRKQLAAVQDLTAETLKMERGSTLEERQGKRGRAHIPHREFRQQADEKRLDLDRKENTITLYETLIDAQNARTKDKTETLKNAQLDASKVPKLQANLDALAQQIAQLKEQYRLDREALKASREAKQSDYQTLKKAHEAALAKLVITQEQADKVPKLEAEISRQTTVIGNLLINEDRIHNIRDSQAQELAQLKAEYAAERAVLKASGEAKQADYQILKKAYEAALADLTSTNAKVTKMDAYSERLKADLVESNQKIAAALEAKAQAIESLVKAGEKSAALLKTANGYREAAAKIQTIALDFKAENVALKAEIVEVKAKFETLAKTHQEEVAEAKKQASELRQLKAEYGGYKEPVAARAAAVVAAAAAKPVPTIQQTPEAELAASDPSLAERVKESFAKFVEWIKSIGFGAQQELVTASSQHIGPVMHMDDLHCIQKTGRTLYAIHQLAHLDNIPALDDPKMEIKYKDGVGHVNGKLGRFGVQI